MCIRDRSYTSPSIKFVSEIPFDVTLVVLSLDDVLLEELFSVLTILDGLELSFALQPTNKLRLNNTVSSVIIFLIIFSSYRIS